MFEGLLKYSLERLDSLEHYYETERKNIATISEDGKKKHALGAMIDRYFSILTYLNDNEKESDQFKKAQEKISKYVEVINIESEENTKKVSYRFLTPDIAKKAGNIQEERILYAQYDEMPLIHGSTTLMMLITRFEEFISNFLEELYSKYPHKYLDNQQLKYSEIASADINTIKRNLVLREVDEKMRESYKEWFKIYSSHGMSCSPLEKDLESMEEIYARRNIIVHNSGVVNAQYLNTVAKKEHKIGDILTVDKAYMQNAFNTIKRITIIMMIESCKLNREDTNKYLLDIFNILFPLLQRGQYEVCEPAYALLERKSETSTQIRIMSRVNKWICVIALRGLDEVRAEIEEFDISALNSLFKLAKVVLLQKYELATAILEELLRRNEINATAIETWPLFLWYRASAEYNTFREQNPDIFDIESVEVNQEECATKIVEENLETADEVPVCG